VRQVGFTLLSQAAEQSRAERSERGSDTIEAACLSVLEM
jgi:hypothetical protein